MFTTNFHEKIRKENFDPAQNLKYFWVKLTVRCKCPQQLDLWLALILRIHYRASDQYRWHTSGRLKTAKRDYTDIGGIGGAFLTTHWSLIENIQSSDDGNRALIGLLLERYWKPVYCYLRQKGYDNEQAKDLTQGFFHEVVPNRKLMQRAEKCKGRFRSFLLHALNQYVIDEKREEMAKKRSPAERLVSLDISDPPVIPQTIYESKPQDLFNYAWKTALLDQVLSQVQDTCYSQGMETHWKVFHDKVVQPILENLEPPSLKEICAKYAVEDEAKASNMIVTVKRRFQSALREYVRNTVISENEVHAELREILRLFPEKAQDSE